MSVLVTKIQFNNFETGEFIEVSKRTYEETVDLIEHFPWNNQRDKLVIDLTNPSVTIEGRNNDFLKLAVFYNGKYVLHYLNADQVLFTKSFEEIKDSYPYINNYFSSTFDTTDFKKEITWFQHNLKHFVSQNFNYMLSLTSVRKYLFSTSGMNLTVSVIFILFFAFNGFGRINGVALIFISLWLFVFWGWLNLILFFNYYFYARSKLLIMSKGNDIFYYGDINSPLKYDKKDIVHYTVKRGRGSRNVLNGFALIMIELKDGTLLTVPNILVEYTAIENKLYQYTRIEKGGFAFISDNN